MIHIHVISIAVIVVAAFLSGYLLRLVIDRLAKRREESEDHVFAGWVARDRNGTLYFHEMRPVKNKRTLTWGKQRRVDEAAVRQFQRDVARRRANEGNV